MRRIKIRPRENWQQQADQMGFIYHSDGGVPYWDESVCYAFTLEEIERDLEHPSAELWSLCRHFVDKAVRDQAILERLKIPQHAWDLIAESWRRQDPSLYGRFDFSYDGKSPAKLLEFNADTPTALFEASVFQWTWLEDQIILHNIPKQSDQFNSLHDKIMACIRKIKKEEILYLSCFIDNKEDLATVLYLADCVKQNGFNPFIIDIKEIGLKNDRFVDLENNHINLMFKLYPWEFILSDEFGRSEAMSHTQFIEPPWKMLLSNKGLLAFLWEMERGHPNLLPAFIEQESNNAEVGGRFVRKPIWSREGANIRLINEGEVIARTGGTYGREGYVIQAMAMLPEFDGYFPVLGSWIIGGEPAGLGIREDATPITGDRARFIPHYLT